MTIKVVPPTKAAADDYHCSACRQRVPPVAALVELGGRSFALCHGCGADLAVRLAVLCQPPMRALGDDPDDACELAEPERAAAAAAWFALLVPRSGQ